MILSGLLPIHIQQNGRLLIKVTISVLVVALSLCACSVDWWVGDARGDWTLELYEGYAISKINSNEILLIYKEDPNDFGGSIVIPNYFVLTYQLHEPYICLEGIRTQKMSISEDELNHKILSHYLVDTTNGDVVGPFESDEDFIQHCNSLGIELKNEWIEITG